MTEGQRQFLLAEYGERMEAWETGRAAIDQKFHALAHEYAIVAQAGDQARKIALQLNDLGGQQLTLPKRWKRCLAKYLEGVGLRRLWLEAGGPTHENCSSDDS